MKVYVCEGVASTCVTVTDMWSRGIGAQLITLGLDISPWRHPPGQVYHELQMVGRKASLTASHRLFASLTGAGFETGLPSSAQVKTLPPRDKVVAFLITYHLMIGLFVGVLFGAVYPPPGKAVGGIGPVKISQLCIVLIFLISGLNLKTNEMVKAIRAPKALLLGAVSILFVTAVPAFALIKLDTVLEFPEFATGLAMFAAAPTTISSAVVIVGLVKGNVALSLLLSVGTNLLAVVIMPFSLQLILSSGDIQLDGADLLWKLLLTILLPLVVGKAASYIPAVKRFASRFALPLKLASSFFLIVIPYVALPCRPRTRTRSKVFVLLYEWSA